MVRYLASCSIALSLFSLAYAADEWKAPDMPRRPCICYVEVVNWPEGIKIRKLKPQTMVRFNFRDGDVITVDQLFEAEDFERGLLR